MSVHTIMMDFQFNFNKHDSVNGNNLQQNGGDDDKNEQIKLKQLTLIDQIIQTLSKHISDITFVHSIRLSDGLTSLYSGFKSSLITIRCFIHTNIVIVNVEYLKHDEDDALISFAKSEQIANEIKSTVTFNSFGHRYPSFKRNPACVRYLSTTDERLIEYDTDRIVFDETSPYQHVQILHSNTYGNMLVLDDLQNLSEKDIVYTETLMRKGRDNYNGKEIVILGGGDGALLYELLKEDPKFVTMIDLDEVVLKACSKFMRSCCGDVLDSYESRNYKIRIGDCFDSLKEMISAGSCVDYVFGDLTDVPVTPSDVDTWDFIKKVLNMSLKVLRSDGKFVAQVGGMSSPHMLTLYEKCLKTLDVPVEFSVAKAFVPSFCEEWVFYQIWKKKN